MTGSGAPIGAVLAGGRGRRLGGRKATAELAGRPLITYPLAALSAVLDEVAVIAKPDTELPPLPGVRVRLEPARPRHPLIGIVEALALADGRPALVCACDLPLLTPALVRALAAADPAGSAAVVASSATGALQPLLACYQPAALAPLRALAERAEVPMREAVRSLAPRVLEVPDDAQLFNVNSPADLDRAAALLAGRA